MAWALPEWLCDIVTGCVTLAGYGSVQLLAVSSVQLLAVGGSVQLLVVGDSAVYSCWLLLAGWVAAGFSGCSGFYWLL